MGLAFHSDSFKNRSYPLGHGIFILPACGAQDETEILIHASVHQKLEVLKYDTHLSSQIRNVLVLDADKVKSAYGTASFGQRVFCYDGPYDRCFSCSDLSYDEAWPYVGQTDLGEAALQLCKECVESCLIGQTAVNFLSSNFVRNFGEIMAAAEILNVPV